MDYPHRIGRRTLLGIIVLLGIIAVSSYFFLRNEDAMNCPDADCLIARAQACEPTTATLTTESLVSHYEILANCTLRKTVIVLINESQTMRELFINKSIECDYAEGQFDGRLVRNLTLGIEACNGRLRDAFDALTQAYQEELEQARQTDEVFEDMLVDPDELDLTP